MISSGTNESSAITEVTNVTVPKPWAGTFSEQIELLTSLYYDIYISKNVKRGIFHENVSFFFLQKSQINWYLKSPGRALATRLGTDA